MNFKYKNDTQSLRVQKDPLGNRRKMVKMNTKNDTSKKDITLRRDNLNLRSNSGNDQVTTGKNTQRQSSFRATVLEERLGRGEDGGGMKKEITQKIKYATDT